VALRPAAPVAVPPVAPAQAAPLRRACQEFEGVFLGLLLQEMRRTLPRGGLLSGGTAGEIFQSLWAQEVARAGAGRSSVGISDMLMAFFARPAGGPADPGGGPVCEAGPQSAKKAGWAAKAAAPSDRIHNR
jgi:flagellar protein FlgJ